MSRENEMKKFVEDVIKNLQGKGIKVNSAAILNIGDNEQIPENAPAPGQVDMNKVNSILRRLQEGFEGQKVQNPRTFGKQQVNEKPEKCFCPDCYKFDTFEDVLREEGSIFDYGEVTLHGNKFQVKYHLSPTGDERIMIKKVQKIDLEKLSLEELQKELNEAVQTKNFANAQEIINEIQERKNKS